MLTLLIWGALGALALLGLLTAAGFGIAWVRSRRALLTLALRLDAEGQVEQATVQTLSAMREAARAYLQRRDHGGAQ